MESKESLHQLRDPVIADVPHTAAPSFPRVFGGNPGFKAECPPELFGHDRRAIGVSVNAESLMAETCFLLSPSGFDPSRALALVERDVVRVALSLTDQVGAVRALFERYNNVPASLADACLVRMSELYESCRVLALDSDFGVYRRHGRKIFPILSPRSG